MGNWLFHAAGGVQSSSYGPTPAHRRSLDYARGEFEPLQQRLAKVLEEDIPALRKDLLEAGAPWGAGQPVPRH